MKIIRWSLYVTVIGLLLSLLLIGHDETVVSDSADLPRLDDVCNPGKPTLVVFTAEWCGYCKVLKEKTLGDPAVKERLKGYVITFVDVEAKESRGLARAARISSLPTTFALSRSCETKGKLEGAYPPEDFLKWLDQVEK